LIISIVNLVNSMFAAALRKILEFARREPPPCGDVLEVNLRALWTARLPRGGPTCWR
jgi:hypothetical protein